MVVRKTTVTTRGVVTAAEITTEATIDVDKRGVLIIEEVLTDGTIEGDMIDEMVEMQVALIVVMAKGAVTETPMMAENKMTDGKMSWLINIMFQYRPTSLGKHACLIAHCH